ncbi:MAG: hypothetical protein AABX29_07540 [Nanoarchaeota archaeon]
METPKIIRNYEHEGEVVGRLVEYPTVKLNQRTGQFVSAVERKFETELGEFDVLDLVMELDPEKRIHMKTNAYGLYKLLQHYGIDPDDYIDDETVIIHCADRGYRNLSDLCRGDHRAWELVKQRGLAGKLFPELQPAVDQKR